MLVSVRVWDGSDCLIRLISLPINAKRNVNNSMPKLNRLNKLMPYTASSVEFTEMFPAVNGKWEKRMTRAYAVFFLRTVPNEKLKEQQHSMDRDQIPACHSSSEVVLV